MASDGYTDYINKIRQQLEARSLELMSSVLGNPKISTSRYYRFLSPTQKKDGSPSIVLYRSGKSYGRYSDFTASERTFDMLQFIADFIVFGDFKSALSWANNWLGGYQKPLRKEAALRLVKSQTDAEIAAQQEEEDAASIAAAVADWTKNTREIAGGSTGHKYLASRNILPAAIPDCLRDYYASGEKYPNRAAVWMLTDKNGQHVATQFVRLTAGGAKDETAKPAVKYINGKKTRGFVRFPGDPTKPLFVCEGPETGMSVWLATGGDVWVMCGVFDATRLMAEIDKSRRVVLCRDDDPPGAPAYKAANDAVSDFRSAGYDVREAWPFDTRRENKQDFNDCESLTEIRRRIGIANYDAPVIPTIEMSIETGRRRMEEYAGEFFTSALAWDGKGEPPRMVVRATVGVGKSEAALTHGERFLSLVRRGGAAITAMRAEGDQRPLIYLQPEHRLAGELAGRAKTIAQKEYPACIVDIYRGRSAVNPEAADHDERMCPRHEEVAEKARLLVEAEDEICPTCPHKPGCAYLAQKNKSADVWIASKEFVFTEHVKPLATLAERDEAGISLSGAAAVVVDETFIQSGLIGAEGGGIVIALDQLTDPYVPVPDGDDITGTGARLSENRLKLAEALRNLPEGYVPLAALRDIGFEAETGKAMAKAEWLRKISDGPIEERDQNLTVKPFAMLWRAIEESFLLGCDVCGWLEVTRTADGALAVRVSGRAKVSGDLRTPMLVVDASADETLIQHFLPRADYKPPIIVSAPHRRIRQLTSKSFGKTYLTPPRDGDPADTKSNAKRLLKLRAVIIREACRVGFEHTAVISNRSIIEALQLPREIETLWFNALAGRDHMKDKQLLITIGRPSPTADVIERQAAILTGKPPSVTIGRARYPKADAKRKIRTATGVTEIPASVDCHPDPICEALRRLAAWEQVEQADGRLRGVNRSAGTACEHIILSDVLLDQPVDEILTDDWLDVGCDDLQLAVGGIAYADGAMMSRAYPDLWKTPSTAREARRQEKYVRISNKYSPLENLTHFRVAGQGARPQTALFISALIVSPERPSKALSENWQLSRLSDSRPSRLLSGPKMPPSVPPSNQLRWSR